VEIAVVLLLRNIGIRRQAQINSLDGGHRRPLQLDHPELDDARTSEAPEEFFANRT